MPKDNANSTTGTSITIQGLVFTAPAPYSAGHVLTEVEAAQLNRTFAENLRNNFSNVVKDAKDAGGETDVEALRQKFAEYAVNYSFGTARAAKAPVDPVEREANKIAKDHVLAALRSKGFNSKNLKEGQLDAYIADYLGTKPKKVFDEAKARVHAAQTGAAEALAAIGLG